jgi:multiple sugar transport system substrate-binding protein
MTRGVKLAGRIVAALLILVLGLGGSGCGRDPGAPKRRITSIHSIGGYSEAARALARDFEQRTGIHVEVVEASFLSLREKELTDLATRAGNFDVLQIAYQWEGEIFPHLRPLAEIAPGVVANLDDFIPTVRSNCGQWEDRVYAIPFSCDVITLLYRTDLFELRAAEFEQRTGRPLRPPQTWEEYLQIARFFNSEDLFGNLMMGREQCFTVWSGILAGMGGRLLDEHWRPVLNSEAGVRSLSFLVEMYQCAPPRSEEASMDANTAFLQGRGAMLMAWPSLIWSDLADTNRYRIADRIGAAVIPGGHPQLSSWSLSINPATRDVDAAARWIQFLVSPENTKRLLLEYGKGSPRISTYADPECKQRIFYHSQLLQGLAGSQARLRIPPSQEMSDYLDGEILKTVRGEIPPKAALDHTAERWREILTQTGYLK